jgi:RNA polymerase sigma-70 factor (ECF subfamily)
MTTQARLFGTSITTRIAASEAQAIAARDFLALYDAYFQRVYNYTRYRCGDAHTADDLTAAIFERVFNHLEDYRAERGVFGAWLFVIARSVVSHHLRAEQADRWLPLDEANDYADGAPSPEESLIHSETQNGLLAALSKLDERERDLLSLKFAARLTNRRIAEITDLSESNVAVILYRAIHRLRSILETSHE